MLLDNVCVCTCSNVGNWFITVSAYKAKVLNHFLCWWLRLYWRPVPSNSNSSLEKMMRGWKFAVLSGLSVRAFISVFSFLRSKSTVQSP